jgi:hypothetical protein
MYLYTSTNGCAGPMTCVWANADSGLGCENSTAATTIAAGVTHSTVPSILNWTPRPSGDPLVTRCTTPQFDGNNTVIPTTYYLLVTSQGAAGGHFVLHLTDTGESCSNNDGVSGNGTPPSHNGCAGARAITSVPFWDDVYPYDAQDIALGVSCSSPPSTISHSGLWYTFTPAAAGNFFYTKIPDETTSGDRNDTIITFFTSASSCSALVESSCSTNADGFLTRFTTPAAHLNAGVTYYIQISDANTTVTPLAQAWNLGFTFVADPGACCTAGACSLTADAAACASGGGSFRGTGTTCSPDPCAGVCCRGCTCTTAYASPSECQAATSTASSAGPGWAFLTSATACTSPSPCCYGNYNHNATLEVQDIFDFLNDWFAGKRIAIVGGDGTTGTLAVQNIFDFLNAWFAGGCT